LEKEPRCYRIGPLTVKVGPGKISDNWGTLEWVVWGIAVIVLIAVFTRGR